jgi:hypothetical protein
MTTLPATATRMLATAAALLLAVFNAVAAHADVRGYGPFRFGMAPAEVRQAIATMKGHLLHEQQTESLQIFVAEGDFSQLPALTYFVLEHERLKMLHIDYYFRSHTPAPKETDADCEKLFTTAATDMASQYGEGERSEKHLDPEQHATILEWKSGGGLAVVTQHTDGAKCIAVTGLVFDGNEADYRKFIERAGRAQ